jgi:hypothetical protein
VRNEQLRLAPDSSLLTPCFNIQIPQSGIETLCSTRYALCSLPLDNGEIDSFFLDQFFFHSTIIVINDLEHFLHMLHITDKPEPVPSADYPQK